MSDFNSEFHGKEIEESLIDVFDHFRFSFNGRTGPIDIELGDYHLSDLDFDDTLNYNGYPADATNVLDFFKRNFLNVTLNYYVNASTGVDDKEHGLSADKPWKTLYYACYHIPRYHRSDVHLYIAAGTYDTYYNLTGSTSWNRYEVSRFYNMGSSRLYIHFEPTVTIKGRMLFERCNRVFLTGTVVFDFAYQALKAAGAIQNYTNCLHFGWGTWAQSNAKITINGVKTQSDGYYRRGIGLNGAASFRQSSDTDAAPLVFINNCYNAFVVEQGARCTVPYPSGTGNQIYFGAYSGGIMCYTTRKATSQTTEFSTSGGGRVLNGAMTSNGRY